MLGLAGKIKNLASLLGELLFLPALFARRMRVCPLNLLRALCVLGG